MVIVVVPLCAVFAARRVLHGVQKACAVVAVLEHEMNVPAGRRGELARREAEIVQHRDLAGLLQDMVDRIQPEPIEAIVAQPRQRILDCKGAHL